MKAILLAAIGVTIALMVLRERPPSEPPAKPAPVVEAAPAAPKQVEAPRQIAKPATPPKPKPVAPVAVKTELKRIPVPAAAPVLAVKREELPREVIPAAAPAPAVERVVAAQPPEPGPNSVFGWGPWSGGAPQAGGADAHVPPQEAVARAQGAIQSVSFAPLDQPAQPGSAAPGSPAVSTLPPVTIPPIIPPPQSVKPGHGWGDKNHIHVHRRDR